MRRENSINGLSKVQDVQRTFEASNGLGAIQIGSLLRENPLKYLVDKKSFTQVPRLLEKLMSSSDLPKSALDFFRSLYRLCMQDKSGRETMSCSYTRDYLGEMINRSPRTITRSAKELEARGFLKVDRCFVSRTKKGVNKYTLQVPSEMFKNCLSQPDRQLPKDKLIGGKSSMGFVERIKQTLKMPVTVSEPEPLSSCVSNSIKPVIVNTSPPYSRPNKSDKNVTYYMKDIKEQKTEEKSSVSCSQISFNQEERTHNLVLCEIPEMNVNEEKEKNKILKSVSQEITEIESKLNKKRSDLFHCKSGLSKLKEASLDCDAEKIIKETNKERIFKKEIEELEIQRMQSSIILSNRLFHCLMGKIIFNRHALDKLFKNQYQSLTEDEISFLRSKMMKKDQEWQWEARKAIFLSNPYLIGHDLPLKEPQIPKNIIDRYYSMLVEAFGKQQGINLWNEVAYSVRMGHLSIFKKDDGSKDYIKGLNIAMKLIREGRWAEPNGMTELEPLIMRIPMSFKYGSQELLDEYREPDLSHEARIRSQMGCSWIDSLGGEEKQRILIESNFVGSKGTEFCHLMAYFLRHVFPKMGESYGT